MKIDGDVIISLTKSDEGLLISPRVTVYCKKGDEYQQIGFIQHMELKTDMNKIPVNFKVVLTQVHPDNSERVKKSINDYMELLRDSGAILENCCTCEVQDNAMGIDPKCPVHFEE